MNAAPGRSQTAATEDFSQDGAGITTATARAATVDVPALWAVGNEAESTGRAEPFCLSGSKGDQRPGITDFLAAYGSFLRRETEVEPEGVEYGIHPSLAEAYKRQCVIERDAKVILRARTGAARQTPGDGRAM